ncbi:MAG: M20 family metallopeptidase [Rhodospirillaceae bacterium]|nr:M20 family metallopeptidase [Rhodospirillaceae bacterium]MBT6085446.1 M20 family metallopeptidase [Rhodospirillaceae bacterium]MBT7509754.1 M20 family metallopeptidase [Rhodospirillaceae bacterium]
MSREEAVEGIQAYFDSGDYVAELARRVAIPSESQKENNQAELRRYLEEEIQPGFEAMEHNCEIFENPVEGKGPVLLATRIEDEALPTVLGYGHGDVVRGLEDQWIEGLNPWVTTQVDDKLYGRGTADNKGQHTINMAAIRRVLEVRGSLGFNSKFMVEMGEENGSPGIFGVVEANLDKFSADVFIASDGPRISPERPTIFLGARGCRNFELVLKCRDGGHHSGNWGGLLTNPGIVMAHALKSIVSPNGKILIEDWRPPPLSDAVRASLTDIAPSGGVDAPDIDPDWGEPGLSPVEQIHAWNSFEVLTFKTGNPRQPVNAVPAEARANCQLRFVAGTNTDRILPALREHLDEHGFEMIAIEPPPPENAPEFNASATPPDDPWAAWTADAMERTTGKKTAVIPSLGGSICNDLFNVTLGLPSIWIPHSYSGCSQHAPNEHILLSEAREALAIMTGLYWDLGEGGTPGKKH